MIIENLVHVPPVRTVVRLADLSDSNLRQNLIENFILTEEVNFALFNILEKIGKNEPQGFFIVGNYGSGKSHLLNVLNLLIADEGSRELFLNSPLKESSADDLSELVRSAGGMNLLPVDISLVEHSNREYLEEIVLSRVQHKLADSPGQDMLFKWEELPRQEAFYNLKSSLVGRGFGGLFLLIDELSEFLRSKDNFSSYTEDVRFLQYMGEFAENVPAWIVATMQENIENTGSLSGEILHKIKDRYPVRFYLTGEHVKEIVSGRLVKKKDAAYEELPNIYDTLLRAFGKLPFSREEFEDLYPVHPQTVELLNELRPLFSQHRGVIDFIHYRLAGDERRGIESFLSQPAEELLTPDYIFDHFQDRIRETVETNPYSEQVFRYFQREVPNIFADEEDARTALRLVKLLILEALAPAQHPFSAYEMAGLLLQRFTDLDPQVNYDYIEEILQKLVSNGAYIVTKEKDDGSGKKVYYLDLKADTALLVKKKIQYIYSTLSEGDIKVIKGLLPWLEESYLPLKYLQENPEAEKSITWQNTERKGEVIFNSLDYLTPQRMEKYQEKLDNEETDFIFFLSLPTYSMQEEENTGGSPPGDKEELAPGIILWVPRLVGPEEEEELRQAYAYLLLYSEYYHDDSPVGKQVKEQVSRLLEDQKRKVKEIFRYIYFEGSLKTAHKTFNPASLGYLHFDELVSQAAAEVLKNRFPRHFEIRPQSQDLTRSLMQRTLDMLSAPHTEEEGIERGTKVVINSYLKPLGIVKKKGSSYSLEFNPKNSPLVAEFFSLIPTKGKIPLQELYWNLRKGSFGLSEAGFQALGLAAVLSGAVSAYQGGKRLSPSQVNFYRFWKIEEIGAGTIIKEELQHLIAEIPFLSKRLREAPLTFSTQQAIWDEVTAFKEEWEEKLKEINSELRRLEGHQLFSTVNWEKLERIRQRFSKFLEEIKVSYSSQEGLERFLAAFQSNPLFTEDLSRLKALYEFLSTDLKEFMRIVYYLKDPQLVIPEGEKYSSLKQRYEVIIDLLQEEEIFWEEKLRERIKREFKLFLDEYVTLYLQEHERCVGPGAMEPYHSLVKSQAYRVLESLGKINALAVEDDIIAVNRGLSPLLGKECRRAEESFLRERPACTCGFVLGENHSLPLTAEYEAQVRRGIRNYVSALRDSINAEKIKRYAENLEMVGRRREAHPLRELLQISPQDEDIISRLSDLLSNNVIEHLNKALLGEAVIGKRCLEDLKEKISNRVFTLEQLRQIIENWMLGEEDKKPDYIKITEKENYKNINYGFSTAERGNKGLYYAGKPEELGGQTGEEFSEEAGSLLQEQFPGLTSLLYQAGEKELVAVSLLLGWLSSWGAAAEKMEDEFNELLYSSLRVQALDWAAYKGELYALGQKLVEGGLELPQPLLDAAIEYVEEKLSESQLMELPYKYASGMGEHFNFDTMLEKFVKEPLFVKAAVGISHKLAAFLSSEENKLNLQVMKGSISEAQKALSAGQNFSYREVLNEKKKVCLTHLSSAAEVNTALCSADQGIQNPPRSNNEWEKLYRSISPFELELERLKHAPREVLSALPLERWRRYYASIVEALEEKFSSYYGQGPPEGSSILRTLLQQFSRWCGKRKGLEGAFVVILDGTRLDIWNFLLERIQSELKLQLSKEGFTWTFMPTVTESQLQPLREEGILGHIVNMNEEVLLELLSDPPSFFKALNNSKGANQAVKGENLSLNCIKFNFIDDKMHTSRDDLLTLLEEILLKSRKELWPLLENIPHNSLVLLLSDHGFRTNLYFQKMNKVEEARYLHGSSSFFEVLAPWALLEKKTKH